MSGRPGVLPVLAVATLLAALGATAGADAVQDLLGEYAAAGAGPFTAAAGEALWRGEHRSAAGEVRACTGCHGEDPRETGRHAVTGRAIEPLAPSARPGRLTDRREIGKWLLRNCKWTLGRECTAQEKGDLLSFLRAR